MIEKASLSKTFFFFQTWIHSIGQGFHRAIVMFKIFGKEKNSMLYRDRPQLFRQIFVFLRQFARFLLFFSFRIERRGLIELDEPVSSPLFFSFHSFFPSSFFSPTENNNKFERYIQPWMNFTRNDDGIVTFIVFIVKRKIFYNTQLMRLVSYFSFFLFFSTSLSTRYTLTSIITIGLKPLP